MKQNILTVEQREISKQVFDLIQKSNSILLHCHYSPDPDSLGSTLATKHALESVGKKVTIISGDSKIPEAFMHLPGATDIVKQNYFETDLSQFDLFLILDTGAPNMISKKGDIVFPPNLKTVVLDHHDSNKGFADLNIVASQYVSTTELLFDLFSEWGIVLDKNMAVNLYVGLFTDGGGFRYERITSHSFYMAGVLSDIAPDVISYIEKLENSESKKYLDFVECCLRSRKVFNFNDTTKGSFVICSVGQDDIKKFDLSEDDYWAGNVVSHMIKSVIGYNVTAMLIEKNPDDMKVSLRTRDSDKFDVSKVALALGGGGHKAASGASMKMPIDEAVEKMAETIKEVLGK